MSVMLGVASAHGPASVANDVIMRITGLLAASTGRRYGDLCQARVASTVAWASVSCLPVIQVSNIGVL